MEKRLTFGFLFLFLAVAAFSQSNEIFDDLLEQPKALLGESAYMILSAADLIPEESSKDEVMIFLHSQDWGLDESQSDDLVSVSRFCYLLMRGFDLSGGIMYSLFPSGRYAYREMQGLGYISESMEPGEILSGLQVIELLGSFVRQGGAQ